MAQTIPVTNPVTKKTQIDRVDNIAPVVAHVREVRSGYLTREPDPAAEMIARYEAQLRKASNRARIAPEPDRQQAAMVGFLTSLKTYDERRGVDVYTHAHPYVLEEVRAANREHSPRPTAARNEAYYWAAMDACDGDANKARHYCQLLMLSINELEPLAEEGDMLAREILDARIDAYETMIRRDPDTTPDWEEYAARRGRGLDGPTFDAINRGVTYLDATVKGTYESEAEDPLGHDVVGDPNASDEFERVTQRVALERLWEVLDDREREIIARHLDGDTDREVADEMGLSRTRVVNIRQAALRKLRRAAGTPEPRKGRSAGHPGFKGHPYWNPPYNGSGRA